MILLNPGPVTLSERVRRALLHPDLCHREPELSELQGEIRRRLLAVYGLAPERWSAVLLTGSGTAAVEAMLSSLMPPYGELLILENGVYGERLRQIAAAHGIVHQVLTHPWQAPIDLSRLAETLEGRPRITHVAAVHHETTTGRLNALAEIGPLCKRLGRGLFVDTVSSFGAEALDLEDWGVTACAATANKCLHGVSGVSFVIVRRDGFPRPEPPARTVYLDLACYARQQDGGSTPFTPSVQVFYALAEALRELEDEGGWRARRSLYAERMSLVHTGFHALGIAPFIPVEDASVVLHAYYLPNGISYPRLHDRLKEHGFVIYAGQADLARVLFRVSTMGAITLPDLERLVGAVEGVVRGVQVSAGHDGDTPGDRPLAKDG